MPAIPVPEGKLVNGKKVAGRSDEVLVEGTYRGLRSSGKVSKHIIEVERVIEGNAHEGEEIGFNRDQIFEPRS